MDAITNIRSDVSKQLPSTKPKKDDKKLKYISRNPNIIHGSTKNKVPMPDAIRCLLNVNT